jgi:hypothetical protein
VPVPRIERDHASIRAAQEASFGLASVCTKAREGHDPMKSIFVLSALGCIAAMGSIGCATTNRVALGDLDVPSVRVGGARILDTRVNPLVPVRVALDGGGFAVSFARFGRSSARERVDPGSLEFVPGPAQEPTTEVGPAPSVQRVMLDGGRFLVCWTSGSLEWGHRAMAQVFNSSDGSPRGGAVAISPSDADVIGTPRAITSDGHRVVAMFAATTGSTFALMAVPIEDASPGENTESAHR